MLLSRQASSSCIYCAARLLAPPLPKPRRPFKRSFSWSLAKQKYNILFCGSDAFSIASLNAVIDARDVYETIRVVTPAPKPVRYPTKGNKRQKQLTERDMGVADTLKEYALERGLPLDEIDSKSGIEGYKIPSPFHSTSEPHPDSLLITASFGYILPDAFLHHFSPLQRLNVHPSLLPRWRGAAPIQWTIASGDTKTGVSVQSLVEKSRGIDAGKIMGVSEEIDVPKLASYRDMLPPLATRGGELLVDTLRKLLAGQINPQPQDPALITRAPKIRHSTARISFSTQTASQIARLARAISHQEPLWTHLLPPSDLVAHSSHGTTKIQLLSPTVVSLSDGTLPSLDKEAELRAISIGTGVFHRQTKSLYIACKPDDEVDRHTPTFIKVNDVKPAGKRATSVWDWWNGLPPDSRKGSEVYFEVVEEGR